ncbi:hypothetical protein MRX96_051472 [Rhipicephalus microplus]
MGGRDDDSLVRLRRFLRTGLEGSRYQAGGVGAAGAKFSSESAPTLHALVEGTMAPVVLQELLRLVDNTDENSSRHATCPEAIAYALALCAASDHRPTKAAAYTAFPQICKCPAQLFAVTRYLEEVSEGTGWGRAHRRAVARWYTATEGSGARQLAAQTTRVVRRHRWTHADLLRLAHVRPPQHRPGVAVVLRYLARGLPAAAKMVEEKEAEGGSIEEAREALAYLQAVHEVRHTKDEQVAARLLEEHQLAFEHVPSHLLRSREVWLCLVRRLPLDELVAHVPRLSRGGLLVRAWRLGVPKHHHHHHHRSTSHQLDDVVAALHEHSFKAVSPTGKRYLVAVDVRGPMTHGRTRGLDGLTPAEVSALMLQALVRTGDAVTAAAFSARGLTLLEVDGQMSLADISRHMRETPMGPVDVSLPLRWAREQKQLFDLVLVCTDNQTQSWSVHPAQALKEFIVCAMCSQGFSLAPPNELGMLDMAGCDSHTLQLIQDFARGNF